MLDKYYEINVPYWDKQICYGSGTAYVKVKADSPEKALATVQEGLEKGEIYFDFNERNCEVDSIEELHYDWTRVKINEDV
jgi:hypothetical protein